MIFKKKKKTQFLVFKSPVKYLLLMVLTEKCSVLTIFEETDVSAKLIHLLVYKFVNSSRQSVVQLFKPDICVQ